jgi:hypothetical protein
MSWTRCNTERSIRDTRAFSKTRKFHDHDRINYFPDLIKMNGGVFFLRNTVYIAHMSSASGSSMLSVLPHGGAHRCACRVLR